jgi:hypothetical protein
MTEILFARNSVLNTIEERRDLNHPPKGAFIVI